jgi:mediator of RNA polymerase II transcription subunit 7
MQRLEPAKANGAPSTTLSADDTNHDRALNLKRLAKSALLNFLEFVGVASIDPDGISEKTDDIETILINMHHGINEYRPHQARESLIQTMQNRLDQIRAETAAVNAVTDKGKRVLEGLGSIGVPTEKDGDALGKHDGHGASLIDDADDVWEDAALWA